MRSVGEAAAQRADAVEAAVRALGAVSERGANDRHSE